MDGLLFPVHLGAEPTIPDPGSEVVPLPPNRTSRPITDDDIASVAVQVAAGTVPVNYDAMVAALVAHVGEAKPVLSETPVQTPIQRSLTPSAVHTPIPSVSSGPTSFPGKWLILCIPLIQTELCILQQPKIYITKNKLLFCTIRPLSRMF